MTECKGPSSFSIQKLRNLFNSGNFGKRSKYFLVNLEPGEAAAPFEVRPLMGSHASPGDFATRS
jgi:hypothetical protein